ncbi:MAG TPA: tyrosine-type recombinase/integrase [Streptosporangiaceae bacterium]
MATTRPWPPTCEKPSAPARPAAINPPSPSPGNYEAHSKTSRSAQTQQRRHHVHIQAAFWPRDRSGRPRFCHENGAPYTSDQLNWRFSKMTRKAGIGRWHAHEGRHTAVSIMSSNGVPIQEISDTVGHKSTHVTETVYRHVIVPEICGGATVMDDVLGDD